ncbi:6104_t:CDS:2 [Acaulospora morrowiae]|uniref:Exosome complex protein n=1 Tax=Acaulospora morrowiae TaxID=94023 RepID=A0A9N9CCR2_9GLOM|nr:6104_t:CDS:2 [Acaulospora morrowiae]
MSGNSSANENQIASVFSQVQSSVTDLSSHEFSKVEATLEALLSQPLSEVAAGLGPIERARLYTLYAYCCNSLSSLYLEVNGESEPKEVDFQANRIQEISDKITHTLNPPQPTLAIDRQAAARFIKHNLPITKERSSREDNQTSSPVHIRFDDNGNRRIVSSQVQHSPRNERGSRGGSSSHASRYDRNESYDYHDRDHDRDYDRGEERKTFYRYLTSPKCYL